MRVTGMEKWPSMKAVRLSHCSPPHSHPTQPHSGPSPVELGTDGTHRHRALRGVSLPPTNTPTAPADLRDPGLEVLIKKTLLIQIRKEAC